MYVWITTCNSHTDTSMITHGERKKMGRHISTRTQDKSIQALRSIIKPGEKSGMSKLTWATMRSFGQSLRKASWKVVSHVLRYMKMLTWGKWILRRPHIQLSSSYLSPSPVRLLNRESHPTGPMCTWITPLRGLQPSYDPFEKLRIWFFIHQKLLHSPISILFSFSQRHFPPEGRNFTHITALTVIRGKLS